jgi:hypothetical protein
MAGDNSVVYVETQPGRFEIRRVVLGSRCGERIAILEGVKEGEQVATRGNFLIDSQMQLAGNPSLIDPTKAIAKDDQSTQADPVVRTQFDLQQMVLPPISAPILILDPSQSAAPENDDAAAIDAALSQLSPTDRALADQQRFCPVADTRLGSMGIPIRVIVNGRPVFICCDGCRDSLLANPVKYLAKLDTEASR